MRRITSASFRLIILLGFIQYGTAQTASKIETSTAKPAFSSLKAVLVVGHLERRTDAAMESMDKISTVFKNNGVEVQRFYDNNADWEKIKIASKGANFFVYSGHGSTMGEGGKAGGLCIKSMVSSKKIVEGLHLAKNAMVVFQSVCSGAGSSATDDGDIGINEAVVRVSDYANPFFQSGASCYYANNLENGCFQFLSDFFLGKTVKECFEKSAKHWAKIELTKKYVFDQTKEISVASTDWGGVTTRTSYTNGVKKVEEIPNPKTYNIAYVANSTFSIKEMMQ